MQDAGVQTNQHRHAPGSGQHRNVRVRASPGERDAAALPGHFQETRGWQIRGEDDGPRRNESNCGSGEYARDAIAHIAQIGRARADVQVIGRIILSDLQLHCIQPGLFRRCSRRDRGKRRLGYDRILQHGHLKGQ